MKKEKICDACSGTGQLQTFKGVSRFLLTAEECPDCAGTGRVLDGKETSPVPNEEDEPSDE